MFGGRGAKGSVNDRLISMMYRNRYKMKLDKEGYRKNNKEKQKEYIQSVKTFELMEDGVTLEDKDRVVVEEALSNVVVDNIVPFNASYKEKVTPGNVDIPKRLHDLSESITTIDLSTEDFDFEHFDYYEVIERHLAASQKEPVLDIEEEEKKVDDEVIILEELEEFIDDSKETIKEIKKDIEVVGTLIENTITKEDTIKLEEAYRELKKKVNKLKEQYDTVKDKYEFEDFHILDSIKMMDAIEDYKSRASLDELEMLVDECKEEIEAIDGIVIEEVKTKAVGVDVEEKKEEIEVRDEQFKDTKKGVIYLDSLEKKISEEARIQRQEIIELERRLANFTTEIEVVDRAVYHTERIFGSFVRIAFGILSVPFTGRAVFGTMLGAHLINRGVRDLRDSLNPEFVRTEETRYRYQNIEREILNSKDYVDTTYKLIGDSITQIDKFSDEFEAKFSKYADVIPEYRDLENKIKDLKDKLNRKKEEIKGMQKDLTRQYEENRVKVYRAS